MRDVHELEFKFKGSRKYIQGPDILNKSFEVIEGALFGVIENLRFTIHKMTGANLVLIINSNDEELKSKDEIVAELQFSFEGRHWAGVLREGVTSPKVSYEYDESCIAEICNIDQTKHCATLMRASPFSAIETIVSMTKLLHSQIFPQIGGSWVFCRWDSPEWPIPHDLKGVDVTLMQALGTRLTRSRVTLNGRQLGQIYFSAKASTL
jgi:hypothetical protein